MRITQKSATSTFHLAPAPQQKRGIFLLGAVALILLLQLFLRAHNITELPLFIDEDNHIQRAAAVHHLEQHPAQLSHGKWFFYILLSPLDLAQRDTALHLSRTMVALSSLLTSAIIFAIIKRLTDDVWLGVLVIAFYALVPYALFYERMALADPWAGTLGALTLWLSIRFAAQPTQGRAVVVGLGAAMTVAAKLTMAFAVGFPVLAALFLGQYASLRLGIKRYLPPLIISAIVFIIFWLPILIPARISIVDEDIDDYVIVNQELIEDGTTASSLLTKVGETWTKLTTMASAPLAILGVLMLVVALVLRPKAWQIHGFLLGCLALAWLPSVLIVQNLQTRYLMSGVPIVAVLLAVGVATVFVSVGHEKGAHGRKPLQPNKTLDNSVYASRQRIVAYFAVGGLLVVWAAIFALPFALDLMNTPPQVTVPTLDDKNYFWDRYNGYGNREALAYLQAQGVRDADGKVHVFPLVKVCPQLDLEGQPDLTIHCLDSYHEEEMADIAWQAPVLDFLERDIPVYVLTSEQADAPPTDARIAWQLQASFAKPREIQTVFVWQVEVTGSR